MARLLIHVEGQTEETFVREVLKPYFLEFGYSSVEARLMGNARLRSRRGGIIRWGSAQVDIIRHLQTDKNAINALLVDYYALPRDWPANSISYSNPYDAVNAIEAEVRQRIIDAYQHDDAYLLDGRFIPHVMLHEFEALLFSDCEATSRALNFPGGAQPLIAIRDGFETPEHINNNVLTAPSKRIIALMPSYNKPLDGSLAALEIGITRIRQECKHFDSWIQKLEESLQNKLIT